MAKLILASVLCIFLLVKGTEAQAAGVACGTDNKCDDGATCEGTTCKHLVGKQCTTGADANCLNAAECFGVGSLAVCTCKNNVLPSTDRTKCGAMGIAASMLLVVATFVTSRFL
ncbi:uncharacterized protein [Littorina saxatilis]|uniref:Uncharacterized protein n=1 Tax=Littorina saxatilis TaxID=31220 RepID=A0AAN9G573_9CAEN